MRPIHVQVGKHLRHRLGCDLRGNPLTELNTDWLPTHCDQVLLDSPRACVPALQTQSARPNCPVLCTMSSTRTVTPDPTLDTALMIPEGEANALPPAHHYPTVSSIVHRNGVISIYLDKYLIVDGRY